MKKLIIFCFLLSTSLWAQNVNIPDANFKKALIETGVDTNKDGEIQVSEAEAVNGLGVESKNISDMTGIEAFVNLQNLSCESNNISNLDVSSLKNLSWLNCSFNKIEALNVFGLSKLENLFCSNNKLASLDVSELPILKKVDCSYNQIIDLKVLNSNSLIQLFCSNNRIEKLEVSSHLNLTWIDCTKNRIKLLELSNLSDLTTIECGSNQLYELNLSKNLLLERVLCDNNNLTKLDLTNNKFLLNLGLGNKGLIQPDLSSFKSLTSFFFYGTDWENVDLSLNKELVYIDFINNLNLEYINMKNGVNKIINFQVLNIIDSTYTGISQNNPRLKQICIDDFHIDDFKASLTKYNMNVEVSSNCSTLDVSSLEMNEDIKIFPNPNNGIFQVKAEQTINSIHVYDQYGRLLETRLNPSATQTNFDLSNEAKGLYFLKVTTDKGVKVLEISFGN